jgi:hypothetical protein
MYTPVPPTPPFVHAPPRWSYHQASARTRQVPGLSACSPAHPSGPERRSSRVAAATSWHGTDLLTHDVLLLSTGLSKRRFPFLDAGCAIGVDKIPFSSPQRGINRCPGGSAHFVRAHIFVLTGLLQLESLFCANDP